MQPVHRTILVACALVLAGVHPIGAAERPPIVASLDDAFIAHADSSDTWSIGSAGLELVVGFSASGTLTLQSLSSSVTNRSWDITPGADVSLGLDGEDIQLATRGTVAFVGATAEANDDGVRLTFNFDHRTLHVRIARIYASYPGSPTIETWTHIDAIAATSPVEVSDLVGWRMTMPLGQLQWIGGLRGDSADNPDGDAFGLVIRDLDAAERIEIGGDRRSSEQFVPFAVVDDGRDQFFTGVMWSGIWHLVFERAGDRLNGSALFPGTGTVVSPARALEVPHTFFGVTPRSGTGVSGALRQFIVRGIRHGRPFQPLVTYNTWFASRSTRSTSRDWLSSRGSPPIRASTGRRRTRRSASRLRRRGNGCSIASSRCSTRYSPTISSGTTISGPTAIAPGTDTASRTATWRTCRSCTTCSPSFVVAIRIS